MKVLIHGTGVMSSILKEVIEKEGEFEITGFADDFTNEKGDMIIDFSHFSRLPAMIDYSLANNIPMVICTTGYDESMLAKIVEASMQVPIVLSSNTCIGINLMNEIVAKLATQLKNFDIEIIEAHHNRKVDSPSGTAKSLFNVINAALDNEMFLVSGRNGLHVRDKKEIGMHSIRGGSVVGEHSVIFYGDDEIIEVKHSSTSRRIFANGAIKAAKFLIDKKPGLYRMKEVLS
ncbi:4-hydroxy-tetrahydrodipicolinate reductase [Brachyspira hampsonii]|uniref:4-hydroxy-tetrahydrodipicolinate reductase n=1 Tax=Brachyspira hampsonii 30446 TaxID=1289135 RepID=A0A2U4F8S1_9SPIR|nr:4-hydroxy-tetrahydrodipicolinate reductase [Brachyspira hampsonii]EKV57780.1 dihydrodipicolinate reductase [Brachyspira hampsonii 30446]MBW5388929.1 4-hydroxy-tetrahydrodipicolinate reductase [Brachyspira hampsonii]MBW5394915.1 4-hydroxy-tetrahydrodipicolinate reductase [Brachyspira hampsonii]OEJ20576.1 4-hydroxy-tetrahydrodipicolinate reductase [Brachyspira hampsonii]PTY41246.1 dihydrodipicolinate reductase [Brachyspira hampsonii bv. II]